MSDQKCLFFRFFFFNDTATTEIYTLSLHDALPISIVGGPPHAGAPGDRVVGQPRRWRPEEHTSELQSRPHLVCRLLLAKKKPSWRGGSRSNTSTSIRIELRGTTGGGPSPLTRSTMALRSLFFFFNDTATTEIYTLSLHDALPR